METANQSFVSSKIKCRISELLFVQSLPEKHDSVVRTPYQTVHFAICWNRCHLDNANQILCDFDRILLQVYKLDHIKEDL